MGDLCVFILTVCSLSNQLLLLEKQKLVISVNAVKVS